MQISDENQGAVVDELHRAGLILMGGRGIPLQEILIVAHAWVMSEMAAHFGPQAAAECARKAALRVEDLLAGPTLATSGGVPVRSVQ